MSSSDTAKKWKCKDCGQEVFTSGEYPNFTYEWSDGHKCVFEEVKEMKETERKPRCKACHPCPMGVVGCEIDSKPHGHGGAQICPICGVPYYKVHPHSNVCPSGTPVEDNVKHDEYHLKWQLKWQPHEFIPER